MNTTNRPQSINTGRRRSFSDSVTIPSGTWTSTPIDMDIPHFKVDSPSLPISLPNIMPTAGPGISATASYGTSLLQTLFENLLISFKEKESYCKSCKNNCSCDQNSQSGAIPHVTVDDTSTLHGSQVSQSPTLTEFPPYNPARSSSSAHLQHYSFPRSKRTSIISFSNSEPSDERHASEDYVLTRTYESKTKPIPIQFYRFGVYVSVNGALIRNEKVFYCIQVVRAEIGKEKDARKFTIKKRYSDLRMFFKLLMKKVPAIIETQPAFPPKQKTLIQAPNSGLINFRIREFERWLRFIILSQVVMEGHRALVENFLCDSENKRK